MKCQISHKIGEKNEQKLWIKNKQEKTHDKNSRTVEYSKSKT